jgi:hypothetical protein
VTGCSEYGDEPSGSGATELLSLPTTRWRGKRRVVRRKKVGPDVGDERRG